MTLQRFLAARISFAIVTLLLVSPATASAWGDRTHPVVNRLALETLRGAPGDYFAAMGDALFRRSLEPDTVMRQREGQAEKIRHFIDLDAHMPPPFVGFPIYYRDAARRFGRRDLERYGVLPWVILRFRRQLQVAIAAGDVKRATREAAYLGHYVADAYQPLHLTRNYDGQLTGARGVHRRFENDFVDARIDRVAAEVRSNLPAAKRLTDPRKMLFEALFTSYESVEVLLQADDAARATGSKGGPEYARVLERGSGAMTREQIRRAAVMLGSLWLTAWVEGGELVRARPGDLP